MKKIVSLLLIFLFALSITPPAFAEEEVLRVYNWQEYIDEGKDDDGAKIEDSVIELWEKDYYARTGKKVRVQYDTFETCETMLNTIKTGKTAYDLACPSDYVIHKMIAATKSGKDENIAIEKFDTSKMPNYQKYVSPFIKKTFQKYGWEEYAVGYMWGTVGFLYNPEKVKREDASSWDLFYNTKYANKVSCKDVSRDAFVVGALWVYRDMLRDAVKNYEDGKISSGELQKIVNGVANDTSDETIEKVGRALTQMKENIYGFEVDSGKSDIVSGKIDANLAWSGDAVYAMDLAEEEDEKELEFAIPNEGSTMYFDGWVMPKGAKKELAQDFVDFLCRPEIAARNMAYIGYTSVIACDEILDMVNEFYGEEEGELSHDVTYFFEGNVSEDKYNEDGKIVIKTSTLSRQLATQYPSMHEAARLGVMEDFGDRNELVLEMWSKVKSNEISAISYITIVMILLFVFFIIFTRINKKVKRKRRLERFKK